MRAPKSRRRRRFLIATALAAGALVIAVGPCARRRGFEPRQLLKPEEAAAGLNAWLKISTDNWITVFVPRAEMGQGVYTALPMLVAEELDADWQRVRVEAAPVAPVYANTTLAKDVVPFDPSDEGYVASGSRWFMEQVSGTLGIQATGGSTSVRDAWQPMRVAGAAARELLLAAAAERWQVPLAECVTESSYVVHSTSQRRLSYGEVALAAARITPPNQPKLKEQARYHTLGRSLPRLDVPAKVTGAARFGTDVRLPDMLYAAVRFVPDFGGSVRSIEKSAIANLPGVRSVVWLPNGIALLADHFWQAQTALQALPIEYAHGPDSSIGSAEIAAQLARDLDGGDAREYRAEGDVETALTGAAKTLEAAYQVPFLAHACMEPMNCTARFADGQCEIWAPTQVVSIARWIAAQTLGIGTENVTVHTTLLGGGFGRRGEVDYVTAAVLAAKESGGRPVQVIWSREEDIQHDMYRPAAVCKFRAGFDAQGKPLALWHRIAGPSVTLSITRRLLPWAASDIVADKTNAEGSADTPYEFPHLRVEHVLSETPVPVGFWRSVGHSYNAFFVESFIDELAHAANADPLEFRRSLLAHHPRHRAVLELAAAKAGWGSALEAGRGRGIALHESFRCIVAQVCEVSVSAEGALKVDRVVCAVDCGPAINPRIVEAQMQSGIAFGLSAALHGEITLQGGRVMQSNFHDYPVLRMNEMPPVETHIVPSDAALGGVGEPGTPPIAPALCNAIFAATGRRVRKLPISKSELLLAR